MNSYPSESFRRFRSVLSFALFAPFFPLANVALAEAGPAGDAVSPVPIISTDEMVRQELLNLDKLLENNPKIEETLRLNIDQITQEAFRMKEPDVDAFLKSHPGVAPALKKERRFLLHRAIARMARGPVFKADIVSLDEFLAAHTEIETPLQKKPGLIVDPNFLIAHPALAKFFDEHAGLGTALLERSGKGKKAGGKSPPASK